MRLFEYLCLATAGRAPDPDFPELDIGCGLQLIALGWTFSINGPKGMERSTRALQSPV